MFKKSLLLMLLMALLAPWAANAQTSLWSENFEGGSMPEGWTQVQITGTTNWSVTTGDYSSSTGAGEGSYNAKFQADNRTDQTRLITPEIDLSGVASAELSFMHIERSWYGDIDQLRIYYRASSTDEWTLIPGQEYTSAYATWTTEVDIPLPNISSTYQLAFEGKANYGYGVGLDNIVIVQGAATPKPSGLAVSGITDNSATLNWNENGTATSWQICVNGDEANLITTSTKPYELTGLTAQTAYTVKVRSVGSPNSDWTNNVSFSTTAVAVAVGDAWSDDFEGTSCGWELVNGELTNQWVWGTAVNNGGTHSLYISNDGGTTNSYTGTSTKVFATKLLNFTDGKFAFSYDWRCKGESTYDFLRVALVPASQTLTAGTDYSTITQPALPTGWIALDNGKLNLQETWQSIEVAVNVPAGNYYLVLAWRCESGAYDPAAAVDNVSITRLACPYDVTDLEPRSITTTGATLTWTAGEATVWEVMWANNSAFENANTQTVSEPRITLSGLRPATYYYVKVRAYCGGSDYGAWCNPISFATECDIIPALGYAENFDSYTAGSGVLPLCWSRINTGTSYNTYPYVTSSSYNAYSPSNFLYFNTYGNETTTTISDQYAVLPEMSDLDGKQITFMAKRGSNECSFIIGMMEDPNDVSTFQEIASQALTTTYTEYVYTLTGSGNHVAIMMPKPTGSTSQYYYVYIDDISIAEPPACPKPSGLAVDNSTINGHGATLSWTSEADAWEVAYKKTADEEFTIINTGITNPYPITGLLPETAYTVKVRANCGSGVVSEWSTTASFTTGVACAVPTGLAATLTPGQGNLATLSWTSDASRWVIAYKTADEEEFTEVTVDENPYTFNSLTAETTYTAKVKAVCGGEDGESQWSSTITFTPTDSYFLTVNDGTTTNEYVPFYGYYADSDADGLFIIPATSLTALQWGTINKLTFYVQSPATGNFTNSYSGTESEYEVYMKETDQTTFESTTISFEGMTLVKNSYHITISDYKLEVTLDYPFDYMGGNLMIGFDETVNGGYHHTYWYGVEATGASLGGYGTSYSQQNFLPKTTFGYTPGEEPSCFKPTGLAVSNVTNHTAELNWTSDADAWQIQVNEGTPIDVTTKPYTLMGLAAETRYSVKVRANCGSDGYSDWTNDVIFTTEIACPAPTNVAVSDVEPFAATVSWEGTAENYNIRYRTARGFNYGFETAEGFVVDEFPPCTTYDGDGLPTYGIDGYTMPNNTANYVGSVVSFNEYWAAHSGNVMGVFMDAIPGDEQPSNDDYFITPELTIAAGDHFIFWARSVTSSYGLERIKVGVYGGNGTITSYLAGSADEYVEVPVAWTEFDYDLTAYAGRTIQLAINCVSEDAFALFIDDLFVGDPNDDTWDRTITNVTSPYTLTGLSEETTYEVQVQAACGGDDGVSAWVDGGNFTTPSNCAAPTNLAADDITISSATLSWQGFHENYNLQYRTAASRETYYFNDFNTDQEGWTFNGLIYGFSDPIYNVSGSNNYFLPLGWNTTEEDSIVSCELPAYERGAIVEFYYFGYQTANTFQVGYSTTTNNLEAFTWSDPIDAPLQEYTRYQEELAEGVKYVAFKATASSSSACVFIDDFGIFGADIPEGIWQTLDRVTTPYSLTDLADDTKYEWQVQGINAGCDGGVTPWSHMADFTTPSACLVPVIDSVTNVEATTATVYWTGAQESFNVRYGAFVPDALIDFDDQTIPEGWTNDETYPWTVTDTLTDAGYCIRSTNQGVSSSTSTISFRGTYEAFGVISFDAMFMGEGTSTYYDKCIFSIDGTQMFAYGAIGQNWYNQAFAFSAGTHTFTWTYSKDDSVNPNGDFFAIDNIKVVLKSDSWTTVEGITGNSYDMTGLTPESVIAVQVQGVNASCDGGVTEWSSDYLFMTPEQTLVTQTIELAAGANWVSFNVDVTLDALKAALVATGCTDITIRGQRNNTKYTGGRWRSTLTYDVNMMFVIIVNADCEITLEGMPLDPAEHSITLAEGNNWIGYPLNVTMTPADAFAGFAENGDRLSSQGSNANYTGGRWRGTCNLVPGKGFIYKSASDKQPFVFPSSSKSFKNNGISNNKPMINKTTASSPSVGYAKDSRCKELK